MENEPIKTVAGNWYSLTCTAAATVTAEIDGVSVTLATLDEGGTAIFCSPSATVTVDTAGKYRVLPTKAAPCLKNADAGGNTPVATRTHATPNGTGNTWGNYAVIDPQHFEAGMLQTISIRARSSSSGSHEIWLGVFEQQTGGSTDPATWKFIGASEQCRVQKNNTDTEWTFKGVQLSGRPIALCAMATKQTGWNMSTQFGAYAAQRPDSDTTSCIVLRSSLNYLPQMSLTIGVPLATEFENHAADTAAHLTQAEHEGLTELLRHKDTLFSLLSLLSQQD